MSALSFRNMLEAGDVSGLRAFWAKNSPHLPQPENAGQAEIVMHRARTEADSVSLDRRAYSHRWLSERMLPSGLPDELKPRAERLYPVVKMGVGISVNTKNEFLQPAIGQVRTAMEHAVLDAEADGKLADSVFVKSRMMEAKNRTISALFGRL